MNSITNAYVSTATSVLGTGRKFLKLAESFWNWQKGNKRMDQ